MKKPQKTIIVEVRTNVELDQCIPVRQEMNEIHNTQAGSTWVLEIQDLYLKQIDTCKTQITSGQLSPKMIF